MTADPRPSRVLEHVFETVERATGLPAYVDPRTGRAWCGACGLPGEPGDARHPADAAPAPGLPDPDDTARLIDLRRLGEIGDQR